MKTRFDEKETWMDYRGEVNRIEDMSTMHLLNVLAYFIKNPGEVMAMLICDVESGDFADSPVWTAKKGAEENMAQSIANITGLSATELTTYALCSDLGVAISNELVRRGVKLDNALSVLSGKKSLEENSDAH